MVALDERCRLLLGGICAGMKQETRGKDDLERVVSRRLVRTHEDD